jgi:uncharacterized OB-fold protein
MTRYLGDNWLLPTLDASNESWFTSGVLSLQRCADCGGFQHPPEDICSHCQGSTLSFVACGETGVVESSAVVHHPVHPWLPEYCPYVIAVISVDGAPGVNVVGNVLGCEPSSVTIGAKVRVVFERVADDAAAVTLQIPQWQLA